MGCCACAAIGKHSTNKNVKIPKPFFTNPPRDRVPRLSVSVKRGGGAGRAAPLALFIEKSRGLLLSFTNSQRPIQLRRGIVPKPVPSRVPELTPTPLVP